MKAIYSRILGILLAAVATMVPCLSSANVPLDRIVAVVNNDIIMLSELEKRLEQVRDQLRNQGTTLPPSRILKKQVLDRLIQTLLQVQLAELNGIVIDDDMLQGAIENISRENQVSVEGLRDILESEGHDFNAFQNEVRSEMMVAKLRQENVERRILINDREVDEHLANRELRATEDVEVRLAHILVAVDEDVSGSERDESRRKVEGLRQKIADGAEFAALARDSSDSQTAKDGGDLGWRKMSSLPALFVDYVSEMQEGELSELIESPSGFHLIQLAELRTEERVIVEQTHVRHILIRLDELVADEDARQRLEKLLYRIRQGDDFAMLAKAHSQDPLSAIEGGDLDWNEPGYFVPEFEEALRGLQEGELSEPFRTQFGWHIVEVLGRRNFDNTDSVRRMQARRTIFERKLEERQRKWLRDMRESAYVEYRLELE
ncbi:MAG: peptidylprolyl isomerase [Candidatus Eutrophobiaceae bacterium]